MSDNEVVRNKSRLTLEKRHQLIDLNKEYINFDITFECKSVDATKDFEMLVINQEQLNTIDLTNLSMKKTRGGFISGNIIADENKYQNYFLIVRSITEDPVEVDLDITIKPMEAKTTSNDMMVSDSEPLSQNVDQPIVKTSDMISSSHIIFIVVGLCIIGGALLYHYWKKQSSTCDGDVAENYQLKNDDGQHSETASVISKASSEDKGILQDLIKHKSKSSLTVPAA